MMNKEIKEILNYMKQYVENKYEHDSEPMLNWKDIQILLDYITNLQQRCEYLERSNNRREDTIIGLRFEVAEQEDYKSRCEKAIEYVNCRIEEFKNAGKSRKEIKAHHYYMLLCDIEKILNSSL